MTWKNCLIPSKVWISSNIIFFAFSGPWNTSKRFCNVKLLLVSRLLGHRHHFIKTTFLIYVDNFTFITVKWLHISSFISTIILFLCCTSFLLANSHFWLLIFVKCQLGLLLEEKEAIQLYVLLPVYALNRRCTVTNHWQPLNKLIERVTDHDLGML